MEVIDYVYPSSWSDKGMDWDDPGTGLADYVTAIRLALMERANVVPASLSEDVFYLSPLRTPWVEAMAAVREAIRRLAPSFVNMAFTDYKPDLSDFPKMWTYRELVMEEGCGICESPGECALLADYKPWLKTFRNVLNKLHAVKCDSVTGTLFTRDGSIHDPPFGESIGTAMSRAMAEKRTGGFSSLPASFYAWSGNTHWNHDDETGEDGYCGYASSRALHIRGIRKNLPTAECDLVVKSVVRKPQGPVSYSQELATSIFDAGRTGLVEGLNTQVVHVAQADAADMDIGDADAIPKNGVVPHSDFDEGDIHRRSAKRGYEGTAYGILDYAVENGFKFQEGK